jgi:hypothetical protein
LKDGRRAECFDDGGRLYPRAGVGLCVERGALASGNERLMRPFSLHELTLLPILMEKAIRIAWGYLEQTSQIDDPELPIGYCWTLSSIWSGAVRDAVSIGIGMGV